MHYVLSKETTREAVKPLDDGINEYVGICRDAGVDLEKIVSQYDRAIAFALRIWSDHACVVMHHAQ